MAYIKNNEFNSLIMQERVDIEKKLSIKFDLINKAENRQIVNKIMTKIAHSNEFTLADRFRNFYNELNLKNE